MPAPLETFLRAVTSSNGVLTPEMYAAFGGDAILQELQKFDPNANWSDDKITVGGEAGGDYQDAKRLNFDWSKLPKSGRGDTWSLNPADHRENLKNPNRAAFDDPVYGSVRQSNEFAADDKTLLEVLGPLFVSMVAPMAGGALAGAGIGGSAGLTAGVTGSGLGGAASVPTWAAQGLKTLPNVARQADNGNLNLMSLLSLVAGPAAGAAGINPGLVKGALTLAQLAKGRP